MMIVMWYGKINITSKSVQYMGKLLSIKLIYFKILLQLCSL